MRQGRKELLSAFLVLSGVIAALSGAFSRTAGAGQTDARLLGKWSRVTDVNAEGIALRPDGTFQILDISYYRMFRTVWRNVTIGQYKVEGDKITFFSQKISTTSKAGVYQYRIGDYEVLKEKEKINRVNEPIKDKTITFKLINPDKIMINDEEFKRDKS